MESQLRGLSPPPFPPKKNTSLRKLECSKNKNKNSNKKIVILVVIAIVIIMGSLDYSVLLLACVDGVINQNPAFRFRDDEADPKPQILTSGLRGSGVQLLNPKP